MTDAVENRIRTLLEEAKKKKAIDDENDNDDDGENGNSGVVKKDKNGGNGDLGEENGDDDEEADDDEEKDTKKNGKGNGKDASNADAVNEAEAAAANKKISANAGGKLETPKSGDNEDNKKSYTDTGSEPETVDPTVTTKKTSADANINKKDPKKLKKAKVTEHIDALSDGEDLSETFKSKAATIFETALNMREQEIREDLEAQYNEQLNEAIEEKEKALVEQVDGYLDYVVEKWYEENELAVTSGLKNEMLESFVSGMKSLFEEHYIEVPETKVDVFEELEDKYNSTKEKLDETVNQVIKLNKEVENYKRERIFNEEAKDLTESQVEKFKTLAEDASFEDEDSYKEKLKTIRESYFSRKSGSTIINEDTVDGLETDRRPVNKEMESVTSTIDRLFVRK